MGKTKEIRVEYDLRPACFDDFHCLAGDCRFTCCRGWQITFDKKDYMSLKRQTGSPELNRRLEHGVGRVRTNKMEGPFYGKFRLTEEDFRCPLQREDGLCMLQLEKGHQALPFVCRSFPRGESSVVSGYYERSLTPACEAVLALLWDLPEGLEFRSDPLPKGQAGKGFSVEEGSLDASFQDIRSQCIDMLQERRLPLPQRILLMGFALRGLAEEKVEPDHWAAYAQALTEQAAGGGLELEDDPDRHLPMFLLNNISLLGGLSVYDDDFSTVQQEIMDSLDCRIEMGEVVGKTTVLAASYRAARARFQERFGDRDYFMENMMVALFFQLRIPETHSPEALWRSYVSFCNLYSAYRFMAVISCREGAPGDRDELFRMLVFISRKLIHNGHLQTSVRDSLFEHGSATLAHMAVLLSG